MIRLVIPYCNRERQLCNALMDLKACSLHPDEVVVAQYGPLDGERATDAIGPIPIVFIEGGGMADYQLNRARNLGITATRKIGERPDIIAVMDADIILGKNVLAAAASVLVHEPTTAIVGATRLNRLKDHSLELHPWTRNVVLGSLQVFRMADYLKVGGYNPFMTGWGFDDIDFQMRLTKETGGDAAVINQCYVHMWHEPRDDKDQEQANRRIAQRSWFKAGRWVMDDEKYRKNRPKRKPRFCLKCERMFMAKVDKHDRFIEHVCPSCTESNRDMAPDC